MLFRSNDTATTEIYTVSDTLSLHDALPIATRARQQARRRRLLVYAARAATLLLVLPILAPALGPLGVDPVHFSIIFTHNMEIGLVHPPVGLNLFVLSTISLAPIGEVIRGILPFLILLLIVLGIITYVPILTLWLPDAVFG